MILLRPIKMVLLQSKLDSILLLSSDGEVLHISLSLPHHTTTHQLIIPKQLSLEAVISNLVIVDHEYLVFSIQDRIFKQRIEDFDNQPPVELHERSLISSAFSSDPVVLFSSIMRLGSKSAINKIVGLCNIVHGSLILLVSLSLSGDLKVISQRTSNIDMEFDI